jgi:adenylate cyclase
VTGGSLSVRAKGFPEPIRVHDLLGFEEAPELRIERQAETLWPVDPPLQAVFTVLEGKRVGRDEEPAEIVAVSSRGAALRAEASVEALSNIKLRIVGEGGFLPGDLYAKAIPVPGGPAGLTRLRFTSIPAELEPLLARLGSGLDFLL